MLNDCPFYFPLTVTRGLSSGTSLAPFVRVLPLIQKLTHEAAVLTEGQGLKAPGLYVFDGVKWRFSMPMEAVSESIINGDAWSIYVDPPEDIALSATVTVYKSGQEQTSDTVAGGTGVYAVRTPVAGGGGGGGSYFAGAGLTLAVDTFSISPTGVTAGTFTKLTVNTRGQVTVGAQMELADVTTALGFTPYDASNPSGYLTANQTITATGDVTGSGTTGLALTLAASGTAAGTFTKVTVDLKGRVTVGAQLGSGDIITALGFTPYSAANPAAFISGNQAITVTGDVTGSGTTAISLALAASGVAAGTFTKLTVDLKGRVTVGEQLASLDVTTALGFTPYDAANPDAFISGNQTITATGDVTGSGTTGLALTLAASGVAAGTYGQVTVDTKGRVTVGTVVSPVANGGTGVATLTGLVKGNGTAAFSAAVAGTDYAPATTGSSILSADAGGFAAVTIGSGLTFVGGTLSSEAGGGGTVTSASVVTANGFAGTVATATTTPAITLTTSESGVLKGAAGALVAATAGTDFSAGTAALATGIVKTTTTTGNLTIALAADFPTLNQNTTGNAATVTTNANLTGDVTSVGNATTLAVSGTSAGTFTKLTVDLKGRVTLGATASSDDLTPGVTNLFFTQALARASVSAGTGITYDSGTGVITSDTSGFVTLAGAETLTNKTLTAPTLGNSAITGIKTASLNAEVDVGNSGAAATVTLANGAKQRITLNSATPTITISLTGAGVGNYQLRIIQDATGGRVPTFSGLSSTRWIGSASTPSINSAINGETIISMSYDGVNITQSMGKVGAV